MKFCWDNIENMKLTKRGNFRDTVKKKTYYFNEHCKTCNDPFLSEGKESTYCSTKCVEKLKVRSKETREKISKSQTGKNNSCWRGGYKSKGIPTYDTYAHQLEWCEEVRRNKEDSNVLEVKCFKCDKWYVPTLVNTKNRIQHLKGNRLNDQRFYCSDVCKKSCSIFNKSPEQVMKEDAVRSGELSWIGLRKEGQLRQMVLERDGHKCIKCGSKENLQCHHILPVSIEPLFSADVDNCISLCYTCHSQIHQEVDGCGYKQLKKEVCV